MLHGWKDNSMVGKPLAACTYNISIYNSFRVRRCLSQCVSPKIAIFTYRSPHFVSHGDAPAIITQYVAWMESQFNACQTPRSIYLSIFNSFRVIRCLSQCISPKLAIFTTFLIPLGTPCGNHAKYCMDGKRIRCLQNNCLAECAHLTKTNSALHSDRRTVQTES